MNANLRNFALWVIICCCFSLFTPGSRIRARTTSQDIPSRNCSPRSIRVGPRRSDPGPEIHGTFTDAAAFQTYAPNYPSYPALSASVSITAAQQERRAWFVSLLVSWLPFIALIGRVDILCGRCKARLQGARLRQEPRQASNRGARH